MSHVPWMATQPNYSSGMAIQNLCFKKLVMFRKRSWFLCAGHSEAAKEATVTPDMDMDMDMDTDTDTVCGPEPG